VEPNHELTDQGFTGQKHNMDLGLYYYNARFYLPGIGRFATADTIVPDPSNPQQYNRYTYTLNNPLRFADPTGHCAEAFDGATREDNLQSDDNLCWSIFYTWFDRGYSGLDPAWDYVREDIWFIEELYLQHGVQFRDAWDHHWSIDQVVDDELYAQRCYGLDCSVSYRRLSISSGGSYLTLKMNGAAAWLFQSFYNTTGGSGQSITKPIRSIGTDPNTDLREAMQNYGTAYTDYHKAFGNTLLAGTGFTASLFGAATPPGQIGLLASGAGLWFSIGAMNDASARQSTYLGQVNQYIYALEVRVYD
jgi:RHS repeat-associated protein